MKKKVLIVDDDEATQYLFQIALEELGLDFETVSNGLDGITKLKNGQFDLVLMDIRMPVLDGYAATRTIRREISKDIPIIAISAHAMDGVQNKCFDAGMNVYMSKPVDISQLKLVILENLNR